MIQEFVLLELQAFDVSVLLQDDLVQLMYGVLEVHEFQLERLDSGVNRRIDLGWIVTHVFLYGGLSGCEGLQYDRLPRLKPRLD